MNPVFVICERDAGLFSLIQQVIANLPRALNHQHIPIVYFGSNCCYWVPSGFEGKYNVWEYYFEPIIENYNSDMLPEEVKNFAQKAMSDGGDVGKRYNGDYYLSNNFGDHTFLRNDCLVIPYEWRDPDDWLRDVASRMMALYVRPRAYLQDRANEFAKQHFGNLPVIGLHIRGTDSISDAEPRLFRKNSLSITRYLDQIDVLITRFPGARIFVATDSSESLEAIKKVYGDIVRCSSTILHDNGDAAGNGPTGALMPAYFAHDPDVAAKNGAEAVIDFLLLRRCNVLIHNGASLARTVLLSEPGLPHINTHKLSWFSRLSSLSLRPGEIRRFFQRLDERCRRHRKIRFDQWRDFTSLL